MEAQINSYTFKLVKNLNIIEVYDTSSSSSSSRPFSYIRVERGVNEKDFHFEISDWYMNHGQGF